MNNKKNIDKIHSFLLSALEAIFLTMLIATLIITLKEVLGG